MNLYKNVVYVLLNFQVKEADGSEVHQYPTLITLIVA